MIVAIDQSPLWTARHSRPEDLARLLEALFHSRRGRRPASRLEVFLLSRALECSEAAIGQHFSALRMGRTRLRLIPPPRLLELPNG
jgi:hypothetical protein